MTDSITNEFYNFEFAISSVGLVCERVLTYAVLDCLITKLRTNKNIASMLHFKDKSFFGYQGDVHVILDNCKSYAMPSATRAEIKNCFTTTRCRICFDKMNVFSDITVGDPHGLDGVDRKPGESVVVVRTERG